MTTKRKSSTKRKAAKKTVSVSLPAWVTTIYIHTERGLEKCGGMLVGIRVS